MHELVWLARADSDFLDLYSRFEELQPGAGEQLIRSVDHTIGLLRQLPHMGSTYRGPFRRVLIRGTNLGLFYTVEQQRVMVQALCDLRQSPEAIKRHLKIPSE